MSDELPRKKILFVDDEPLVLQGLQRMLRGMRDRWDMTFVDGGAKALETMATGPFDVVVSDMRMPGMNGAELLVAVMERYPDTIRIILSGHADRDMIIQCLGAAHQYLSKPCDPELLKTLIDQACSLGSDLASDRVKHVVGRIETLPSVPTLYQELTQSLASENTSSEMIGEIISQDIGMTAKVLKLVNSAFFGLRREFSNPTEAVTYLGTETIRSLVLAESVFGQIASLKTRQLNIDQIWAHSLAVAHGAQTIARVLDASEESHARAFTAGLLHDSGILILAHNFPDLYDDVTDFVSRERYLVSFAEQRVFGVNHGEVGAYLMGLWGLPALIVQAIHYHHTPTVPGAKPDPALFSVHIADALMAPESSHVFFESSALDPVLSARPEFASRMDEFKKLLQASHSNHPKVSK